MSNFAFYNGKKLNTQILPFLKWAGGKRWFANKHWDKFPKSFSTYIEPFLGSGAIFFFLQPKKAILSDTNTELISTYCAILKNYERVYEILQWHQSKHNMKHYYQMRSKVYKDPYYKAAKFIYLNRTCWNGLYRVNSEGQFNVPIGTKTQVLLDTDRFANISSLLKNSELVCCDFEETINRAKHEDFIFADPPYTTSNNSTKFLKYNDRIFSWSDQVRLYKALMRAKERGVKILLTNGPDKSIRELFSPLGTIYAARRASVIAGKAESRTVTSEIVVCG